MANFSEKSERSMRDMRAAVATWARAADPLEPFQFGKIGRQVYTRPTTASRGRRISNALRAQSRHRAKPATLKLDSTWVWVRAQCSQSVREGSGQPTEKEDMQRQRPSSLARQMQTETQSESGAVQSETSCQANKETPTERRNTER